MCDDDIVPTTSLTNTQCSNSISRLEKMQDKNAYAEKAIQFLKQNPPTFPGYEFVPAISISYPDTTIHDVETFLKDNFGHVELLLTYQPERFCLCKHPTTSFWMCDEKIILDHIPHVLYKSDFGLITGHRSTIIHITGGYYAKPLSKKLDTFLTDFETRNNQIHWHFDFHYWPSAYHVSPYCMMEEKDLLFPPPPPPSPRTTRRRLRPISDTDFVGDRTIRGGMSLKAIEDYCQKNAIVYDSIYAFVRLCSQMMGVFKVLNNEDVEFAIKKADAEGGIYHWILASKETADMFEEKNK